MEIYIYVCPRIVQADVLPLAVAGRPLSLHPFLQSFFYERNPLFAVFTAARPTPFPLTDNTEVLPPLGFSATPSPTPCGFVIFALSLFSVVLDLALRFLSPAPTPLSVLVRVEIPQIRPDALSVVQLFDEGVCL